MNGQILPCLLGDAWGVGAKLQASPVLRAEAERRKPIEFIDAFLEVVTNARRFELVSQARDRVQILSVEQGELEDKASGRPALLRFRRVVPGPEQRGQRDRALPRPAGLHPDLGRPDLRARPDP